MRTEVRSDQRLKELIETMSTSLMSNENVSLFCCIMKKCLNEGFHKRFQPQNIWTNQNINRREWRLYRRCPINPKNSIRRWWRRRIWMNVEVECTVQLRKNNITIWDKKMCFDLSRRKETQQTTTQHTTSCVIKKKQSKNEKKIKINIHFDIEHVNFDLHPTLKLWELSICCCCCSCSCNNWVVMISNDFLFHCCIVCQITWQNTLPLQLLHPTQHFHFPFVFVLLCLLFLQIQFVDLHIQQPLSCLFVCLWFSFKKFEKEFQN